MEKGKKSIRTSYKPGEKRQIQKAAKVKGQSVKRFIELAAIALAIDLLSNRLLVVEQEKQVCQGAKQGLKSSCGCGGSLLKTSKR